MKSRILLLVAALLGLFISNADAAMTLVRNFRMGEADPGAIAGGTTTNSIDSVNGYRLTFAPPATYSSDTRSSTNVLLSLSFPNTVVGSSTNVLTLTNNFCVEAWVKPATTAGSYMLMYSGSAGTNGWGILQQGANYSCSLGGLTSFGSAPVSTNDWTHVALVCSNNTAVFFVNGIQSGQITGTPFLPTSGLIVGMNYLPGGTPHFQGLLDDLRVSTFGSGFFSTNDLNFQLYPSNLTTFAISGSINPQGTNTTAWLEWGAGDMFDQTTLATNLGSGFQTISFTNNLKGLTPGLPYQYRVVASNVTALTRSMPRRFWTTPLSLIGDALITTECHSPFVDPGTEAPVIGFGGGNSFSAALKSDGTVVQWGGDYAGIRSVPTFSTNDPATKVVKLAAGSTTVLALLANGTVTGWGSDFYSQVRGAQDLSGLVDIAIGAYHGLGLRSDGTVVAWGCHSFQYGSGGIDYGQLDVPAEATNVTAIAAGLNHSLALRADGTVLAWGQDTSGQTLVPIFATNVVAIAAGATHSLALRKDGKIIAWGSGSGTNFPSTATNVMAIAARLDSTTSMCVRSNGTIVNWGGLGSAPASATNVVAIALGGQALARRADGVIVAWGSATNVSSSATNLIQMAANFYLSLGLRADGSVVTIWSDPIAFVPSNATNVVALSGGRGSDYVVGLRSDGTNVMWGDSASFLGTTPASVTNLVAVAAGYGHCVGLRSNSTVVAWGSSYQTATNVPAGTTNIVAVAAGYNYSLALRSDGTVIGWGNGLNTGQTNFPASATNITAIAAGYRHALALRSDRTIVMWGDGSNYGITNIPVNATNVVAIAAGYDYSLVLRGDGTVVGWGYDNAGNTFLPPGATNIVSIGAGYIQSFALRNDGRLFCFGSDAYGQSDLPADITRLNRVSVSGTVNTNLPGTYTLNYAITNLCGVVSTNSRTVVVVDRTPPVITVTGNNPLIQPLNLAFTDPGATSLDACGGAYSVVPSGSVDSTTLGSYLLTYVATDSSGNAATNTRTVLVSTAPSVSGLGASVTGTNSGTGLRTVQLSAAINPNGPATTVTFEYGLTPSYGASPVINLPASFASTNLAVTVNVNFGATYHWRVTANHSAGSTTSPDQVITIASPYGAGDLNGDGVVTAAELSSVYASYLPTSPWLALTNVAGLGGTNVTFSLANFTNENYKVEYSTNLTDWYSLGDATPRFEFGDTNAPANPQRFYRLRAP